jgi:hypothetical protein
VIGHARYSRATKSPPSAELDGLSITTGLASRTLCGALNPGKVDQPSVCADCRTVSVVLSLRIEIDFRGYYFFFAFFFAAFFFGAFFAAFFLAAMVVIPCFQ